MFPDDDNNIIHIEFNSKNSISKEKLQEKVIDINKVLDKYPEILFYYTTISNSNIFTYIELKEKDLRKEQNLKTAQDLVKYF
jgi:multidrug efflux pump subunit AcrB